MTTAQSAAASYAQLRYAEHALERREQKHAKLIAAMPQSELGEYVRLTTEQDKDSSERELARMTRREEQATPD